MGVAKGRRAELVHLRLGHLVGTVAMLFDTVNTKIDEDFHRCVCSLIGFCGNGMEIAFYNMTLQHKSSTYPST